MKCHNCDREAVYPDGLCEECHRLAAEESERVKVLSQEERENFNGQTIDEDGSVHSQRREGTTTFDTMFNRQDSQDQARHSSFRIFGWQGLSLRTKAVIGLVLLGILAFIGLFLTILIHILPFLLLAVVVIIVLKFIGSLLR